MKLDTQEGSRIYPTQTKFLTLDHLAFINRCIEHLDREIYQLVFISKSQKENSNDENMDFLDLKHISTT